MVKYIKDNGTAPLSTELEFSLTIMVISMRVILKMGIAMGLEDLLQKMEVCILDTGKTVSGMVKENSLTNKIILTKVNGSKI